MITSRLDVRAEVCDAYVDGTYSITGKSAVLLIYEFETIFNSTITNIEDEID